MIATIVDAFRCWLSSSVANPCLNPLTMTQGIIEPQIFGLGGLGGTRRWIACRMTLAVVTHEDTQLMANSHRDR